MQNGTYRIKHKLIGTEYRLVAYNGKLKLLSKDGAYIKHYHDVEKVLEHCDVLEKVKEDIAYTLHWYVGGSLKERLKIKGSWIVCKSMADRLSKSTHKLGKLVIARADL